MANIIRDYSKLRDWEVEQLIKKGYEEAIAEGRRRGWNIARTSIHMGIDGKRYIIHQAIIARKEQREG